MAKRAASSAAAKLSPVQSLETTSPLNEDEQDDASDDQCLSDDPENNNGVSATEQHTRKSMATVHRERGALSALEGIGRGSDDLYALPHSTTPGH